MTHISTLVTDVMRKVNEKRRLASRDKLLRVEAEIARLKKEAENETE